MASFNQITLLGNVGQVDVRTFGNGEKVVQVSLATSTKWTGKDGNTNEETQWHTLQIYGRLAEVAEKYIEKGSPLFVTGQMIYRKWTTKEGDKRISPEVRVNSFQLLSGKPQQASHPAPVDNEDMPY